MCGIIGFTGEPNSTILERMTSSIQHRGPDDEAFIVNKNFSVGFRRLAIIDLTENIYPIQNERKTIELVLNGEIYNYQELRDELTTLGHEFVTESDSETIVHGYEEWGVEVLQHLRGMFVFVLLDKEKNQMLVARDRLGIKPLYYSQIDGRVVFGSEIKGLLSGFDIDRSADDVAVYRFLTTRIHDIDERTFFKNIKRVLPGHFMLIEADGSFDIKKYWHPEYNPKFKSQKPDKVYADEFQDVLTEAVKLHLIGDVPVGVTLSGGLDSSGITSLSHKLYTEEYGKANMFAFSAVHPGETIDESEYIDSVVEYTGVESVRIQPQLEKFWDEIEDWIYFQEEPVISGAPYAYNVVMREARKKVTVLLSGQGGDELLAGYIPYFLSYFQSAMDNGQYWSAIREVFRGSDLYWGFAIKKLLGNMNRKPTISPERTLDEKFMQEYKDAKFNFEHKRNLNERLFEDVTSTTTPAFLRYEDKNSMNHSLESRVPLLDHVVVEYIFNLPIDQKIKHGWNRYIYRQAMKGIIPDKNRKRRSKIGFVNPEWEWIERKADTFRGIFNSDSFKSRPYWNAEYVLRDFELTMQNKLQGDVLYFWRLFITEMWMRQWVDQEPKAPHG